MCQLLQVVDSHCNGIHSYIWNTRSSESQLRVSQAYDDDDDDDDDDDNDDA